MIFIKNAVLYCRMSTDKQEYSIQSQKRLLFEYAENNNFNIINCYEDKGLSGRDAQKRPAFMSMINDSYKKNFQYILIYDSSRFARNLEQSLIYKSILKNNNIKIISATEPNISDDNQILTDAIIGAMNEMYSIRLSKVVKRGMKEKALKGEYMSQAPFGYTKPKGEPLKINQQEALIVTKIFNEYLNNNISCYSIAKMLNNLNVKTKKGNSIDTRFIHKVLTNPTYKGYYKFTSDDETIINKSNHKPIIQEDIFDSVQQLIHSSKHKHISPTNYKINNKHWLTGLIRCETCGSTYVYAKYYNNRQDRFRCGGYTTGKCSNWYSIRVSEIESIVLDELKSLNYFTNKTYVLEPNLTSNNNSLDTNLINNINQELKKLKKGLLKIKQAYIMEVDTLEEYKQNKDLITNKIKELEDKLEVNTDNLSASNNSSIKLNLNNLTTNNLNNYLAHLIINKILIKNINNNVNINIFFNIY